MTTDATLIVSTAHVIQSRDNRVVILCYRGTEPLNVINWLTSGDVVPETVTLGLANPPNPPVNVHGGFYRNMRATSFEVVAALDRAVKGQSVHAPGAVQKKALVPNPLEAIYVTGHSLGGAMAVLMAIRLVADRDRKRIGNLIRAVYTFGQPMIGDSTFTQVCDRNLGDRLIRYVYGRDVVPHLPPAFSGPFKHGQEREFRYRDGSLRHSVLAGYDDMAEAAMDAAEVELPSVANALSAVPRLPQQAFDGLASATSVVVGTLAAALPMVPHLASNVTGAIGAAALSVPGRIGQALTTRVPNPLGAVRSAYRGGNALRPAAPGNWIQSQEAAQQVATLGELGLAPVSFTTEKAVLLRSLPFPYELEDHLPEHYVSASSPLGVDSEYD